MKSIQTKFILLILSCVFLCFAVLGGGAIYTINRVVDQDSERFINLQCMESAERFNNLLARIKQSVKTLSTLALEELDDVEQFKEDDDYVEAYTKRLESIALSIANNTEGAVAVYVRFNPELTLPDSGLFWSKTNANGAFEQLPPTNLSDFSSSDLEHVGWYYTPVQRKAPVWMEPYYNQNIKLDMISYVIPLYKSNEIIGVAGMDIDFSVLENLSESVRIYETGYAFLCNAFGTVMYHPSHPKNTILGGGSKSSQPVVLELQKESSGNELFSYTEKNEVKRMAYRTLDNGMRLAVTAPLREIDAVKQRLIMQSLLALSAISIAFILITIVVTRRMIRPLRELNLAAKKIAEGDLDIILTQSSNDEVGDLSKSFQQTVHQLETYINYINSLAYRDALTGVKNKAAYQEVEQRLEMQMRLGQPNFAIVVLDINHLKETNDRYGHDFGDLLIIEASRLICKTFRQSPVYRIGGDEFVVILENYDYDNYGELIQSFYDEMKTMSIAAQPAIPVRIACGIALFNPETDLVFSHVFKRADDAMYKNKAAMKAKNVIVREEL